MALFVNRQYRDVLTDNPLLALRLYASSVAWLNQSDPKNIQTGNPLLNPELSHATELAYSLSAKSGLSVNTSLYWRL
ncbi:MAG: hypothetical protein EOO39_38500, partial [Cytophagaceae bacterium]